MKAVTPERAGSSFLSLVQRIKVGSRPSSGLRVEDSPIVKWGGIGIPNPTNLVNNQ